MTRRRVMYLAAAGVAVALAVGLAIAADSDDDSPEQAVTSSTTTSSSVPTTSPADPLVVGSYLSTDRSRPALLPDCYGLLGACLHTPIDPLAALLGPEARRSDGPEVAIDWTLENQMRLTVVHDANGSINLFVAYSTATSPDSRLGLPDGLVLGEATLGDVQAIHGDAACEEWFASTVWNYLCRYPILDGTETIGFLLTRAGSAIPVEQRSATVVESVIIGSQ